jgi:hypothetical protein
MKLYRTNLKRLLVNLTRAAGEPDRAAGEPDRAAGEPDTKLLVNLTATKAEVPILC